ncbi:MAG: T9SS type A sorting domain-containing protein [Vicingaceae bacterium]
MKKTFIPLIISLSLFSLQLHAQYIYEEVDSTVTVEVNGQILGAPFTGGYNTAQFSEFDLDQDGTLDLLVYDRALGQVRPYLNAGIPNVVSYSYAPHYAQFFPAIQDWLKTADYNNDGKMDLIEGRSNIVVWKNTSTPSSGLSFEIASKLKSLYSPQSPSKVTVNPSKGSLPGFYDMNNDNDLDLFLFNSNAKSMDYHRNLAQENAGDFEFDLERRNTCWGTFIESGINSEIFLDSCQGPIPPNGELSKIDYFGNQHQLVGEDKGLKHAGSTVNPIDIDNNGTMDLLIADVDAYQLKLLINEDTTGVNSHIVSFQDSFPNYDKPIDLLYPAVYFIDVNNDGFKDMIASPNAANTSIFNAYLTLDDIYYYENIASDGSYQFNFQEKRFFIDQTLDFGLNAYPIFLDYNKDGLKDLLVGNDGYVNESLSNIKGQLALFENIGNTQSPKFRLVDNNYLNIPSLKLDIQNDTNSRNITPTSGDLDGDGDDDLLIGEENGNIFFFEDTSSANSVAAFKFHPNPYQGLNIRNRSESDAPVLYDINNDSLLDCIVTANGSSVNYFLNFGTATNPMLNIKVDSIIWQLGSTFRYYFKEAPNFSLLHINDTMAVHNALNLNNNSFIQLVITTINEAQNYIECKNITIPSADASFNELGSSAYMTFFNRDWGNLNTLVNLSSPRVFPYRENGKTQLIVVDFNGSRYFFNEISDTLQQNDTFNLAVSDYLKDYGIRSFVSGTDLNGDDKVDLAFGNFAGGIKLLFATNGVGVAEFKDNRKKQNNFFSLYPNPAKESVTVLIDQQLKSETTLFLRNASGKLVLKKVLNFQTESLNTSNLPSGLYFITLQNEQLFSTRKLIIKP